MPVLPIAAGILDSKGVDLMQALLPLLGRILLAAIFLWSAIKDIREFEKVSEMMGARGIPIPSFFLLGTIVFLLLGSIAMILGIKARWGAVLLILFLIPVTIIFHSPTAKRRVVDSVHEESRTDRRTLHDRLQWGRTSPSFRRSPGPAMKKMIQERNQRIL